MVKSSQNVRWHTFVCNGTQIKQRAETVRLTGLNYRTSPGTLTAKLDGFRWCSEFSRYTATATLLVLLWSAAALFLCARAKCSTFKTWTCSKLPVTSVGCPLLPLHWTLTLFWPDFVWGKPADRLLVTLESVLANLLKPLLRWDWFSSWAGNKAPAEYILWARWRFGCLSESLTVAVGCCLAKSGFRVVEDKVQRETSWVPGP